MRQLTPALLQDSLGRLDYAWASNQPNLIGIRTTLSVPNVFNDLLACCWVQPALPPGLGLKAQQQFLARWFYTGLDGRPIKADGIAGRHTNHALEQLTRDAATPRLRAWVITTTPGVLYLHKPLDRDGCAVLVPGQYRNTYQLGNHQDKADHPALVQTGGKVKVYRDNDRDSVAEATRHIEEGYFGINIHRADANGATPRINGWSAGCQVFQRRTDLAELLSICETYRQSSNNRFTYTLLREAELS